MHLRKAKGKANTAVPSVTDHQMDQETNLSPRNPALSWEADSRQEPQDTTERLQFRAPLSKAVPALAPPAAAQQKGDMELLERVQQRATKMVKGQEHFS